MQLTIRRSQRTGGMMGKTVLFCLDVRAEYSAEEKSNIAKYKIGNQTLYTSPASRKHLDNARGHLAQTQVGGAGEQAAGLARGMLSLAMSKLNLNITIDSLAKGQHIECKDMGELLEAEETVREACRSVSTYLAIADSFNGSETLIEYADGEERVRDALGPIVAPDIAPSPASAPPPSAADIFAAEVA